MGGELMLYSALVIVDKFLAKKGLGVVDY